MVMASFCRPAAVELLAVAGPGAERGGGPPHPAASTTTPKRGSTELAWRCPRRPCFDCIPSINVPRRLLLTGPTLGRQPDAGRQELPDEPQELPNASGVVSQAAMNGREELTKARRLVVKVGSRSLASDSELIPRLAREIASVMAAKRSVVLVSSGAIALGTQRLGSPARPKETAKLQAAAAAGQSVLMRRYDVAFAAVGVTTAQVLL